MSTRQRTENGRDRRDRRWDDHRRERRDDLTRIAAETVDANGPDLRIDAVAKRAGIARPLLYRHFDGTAHLEDSVVQWAASQLTERMQKGFGTAGSPQVRVQAAARQGLQWVSEHPRLTCFCVRRLAVATDIAASLRARIAEALLDTLTPDPEDDLIRPVVPVEATAAAIMGLGEATVVWWIDQEFNPPIDVLAAHIADLIDAVLAVGR